MPTDESELDRLLARIAEHVDLQHQRQVDERYRRALAWENVDHPPLIVRAPFPTRMTLPSPWDQFQRYPYNVAFNGPAAMMQNMLLDRVVPGLILADDSPLAIRADHGTIQTASLLGARWMLHEDNYPWVEPITTRAELERIAADTGPIDLSRGVTSTSLKTLRFFREKLREYPPCDEAIQISMPDLQGPIDTAEQLWGSELFADLYEAPELVAILMRRIVDAMLAAADEYRRYATDRLDPIANTQHGYVIPGRFLIRDDSAVMISPQMYAEHVRTHDARILHEMSGGAIHFCGDGRHLLDPMLDIEHLNGLDFGESHLMDMNETYAKCRQNKVAITGVQPPREDLVNGITRQAYPTGIVLVYSTTDLVDAQNVISRFQAKA